MGLYGSQYNYAIHIVLIATSCVLLITSFQPRSAVNPYAFVDICIKILSEM